MAKFKRNALDYFAGGVPAGEYFRMTLRDIKQISDSGKKETGINRLQEICFIGLLSYFEGFCKDHFASIINLEPSLIGNLKAAGHDVSLDATHIALYGRDAEFRLGFVLASKFDFGTAQKINALYSALLKINPFSKDEARQFDSLLRDRHLLVHHGGILTLSYLQQQPAPAKTTLKQEAFFNSRVIGKHELSQALSFIDSIATKLVRSTHAAIMQDLKRRGIRVSGIRKQVLNFMKVD
jgi:hypothetical protein